MTYQCPQCGLPRTGNQAMGLAMPQCVCSWQFTPPQTPPPKREWVGLTDDEIDKCCDFPLNALGMKHARMIEAKLREKNGGQP